MSQLKQVLDNLEADQKQKLMYGFEFDLCTFVEYEPGKYIGVHTDFAKNLQPEETRGVWTLGIIVKKG